ncbi:MAG: Rieske 2Fe-2S domain-containing protein [Kiritimatiellaceae bacterium]|nr:Rieske 2Fe-2S domain-containing protein [Kiritimatiellaceae bacterium]
MQGVYRQQPSRCSILHLQYEWIASEGRCPHQQGPMVDSKYVNGRIVCPLHSYSFDVNTGFATIRRSAC